MNIKNTLFGFTLLGIGGLAGYFLADKKLKARYQEDLADVQDFYYKKLQEAGIMEKDFEPEVMTDEEMLEEFKRVTEHNDLDNLEEIYEHLDNITQMSEKGNRKKNTTSMDDKVNKGKGRPIINYNKPPLEKILADIEAEKDDEDEEDPEDVDLAYEAEIEARAEEFAQRRYENQVAGEPYCINYDEMLDRPEEYDIQTLYYYAKDRVLCEDDDSIVDDEEELIGLDYEDVLGMQTIAWVRNDKLCIVYAIHRIDESYASIVGNAIETPREREFRILARRKQALDD